jgi:hypothetical protein
MLKLFAAVMAFASATPAFAADPTGPVREIIETASRNWSADSTKLDDYFSKERLERLFSAEFAAVYQSAERRVAARGGTVVLDHDPIIYVQDGCPLKNIAYLIMKERNGKIQVDVRFTMTGCLDGQTDSDEERQFSVIREGRRFVIDDMFRVEDGKPVGSLKDEVRHSEQ